MLDCTKISSQFTAQARDNFCLLVLLLFKSTFILFQYSVNRITAATAVALEKMAL